jgi:hypothetical protein
MFQNRVLRKILGCYRNDVTGDWRNLCNGKFHNFHSPSNIIWKMRFAGSTAPMLDRRSIYSILLGQPTGRLALEDLCADVQTCRRMLKNQDKRD